MDSLFYLNYAESMLNYVGDGYTTAPDLGMTAAAAINVVRTRAKLPNVATGLSATDFVYFTHPRCSRPYRHHLQS